MRKEPANNAEVAPRQAQLRIYVLPNLLTGANLFCGFMALTKIVEADPGADSFNMVIRHALGFILLAFVFDLLDGRVARWGGHDSPFGREFDSLADLVSFGVAPAFLVHRIVLRDVFVEHQEVGWFIASVYLLCGALRLARFNCLSATAGPGGTKEFTGFPIPAAAGLVASLTLFLLWLDSLDASLGGWRYVLPTFAKGNSRYVLPVILLFLSIMMVSGVKYPSFKTLDLHARRPFTKMVAAILFIGLLLVMRMKILPIVLPVLFTTYLLYGFVRPRISRRVRQEIEEEQEEDEDEAEQGPEEQG
jgi:CDP-diacylglycerol--serine O-phosphatidyltransferase